MSFADQSSFQARCEWGLPALEHLAPAEIIIVVDVLSFSTCVEVATKPRGANLSLAMEGRVGPRIRQRNKRGSSPAPEIVSPAGIPSRSTSRSPPRDHSSACVLPSPNGSTLSLKARETGAIVIAGCLRNASAIGSWLRAQQKSVTVIPAGERWPDGSIRHAIEDLIGAGAILSHLDTSFLSGGELAVAVV